MTAYESSYVSWYIKSNRKKLMVGFGILFILLILPIFMVQEPANYEQSGNVMQLPLVPQLWIVSGVCGVLSVIMPILQFQHLMKKRSCDLYLPLPIKRNHFFVIQFVVGLCYILIPILMFFAIAACERKSWEYLTYYAFYFVGIGIFLFALYSLITYFVVHCNSFWDALCSAIGFAFVFVFLFLTINELLGIIVQKSSIGAYDASEFFPMKMIGCVLSPIVASGMLLTGFMEGFYDYQLDRVQSVWESLAAQDVSWIAIFVYWLLVLAVSCWLAYRTYHRRAGEQSEQRTTSKAVYPLFIVLITSSLLFQNFFDLGMLWVTIIVFFVLNFIAERRIVVHKYMILSFVVMAVCTSGFTYTLIETGVFHTIYEVPEEERIQATSIRFYFNEESTAPKHNGEAIQSLMSKEVKQEAVILKVLGLHEELVSAYASTDINTSYGISISYELLDGKYIDRSYSLDYEKYKKEVDSLIKQLYDENQVDQIATSYFIHGNQEE